MKIQLDNYGKLLLGRKGVLKPQMCPHRWDVRNPCGDSCPHFHEPNIEMGTLEICNGLELRGKIEDLREMKE